MSADELRLADTLAAAAADLAPIPPFTDGSPELDEATAYRAQWLGIERRLAAGERVIGAKLGLTSRAKQQSMGVHQPLYGWLTSGMVHEAGAPLERARFIHPRAEPEIAFLLGDELEGPVGVADVLAGTEAVLLAIEVLDSRYAEFRFRLPDVVADNASAAAVVTGPVLREPEDLEDLRLLGCVLRVGGEVVATAAGGAVMGHPAAAVAWLVNRLAAEGRSLPAGALVLSGGLTDAVPLEPGTVVTAEIDGLGTLDLVTR